MRGALIRDVLQGLLAVQLSKSSKQYFFGTLGFALLSVWSTSLNAQAMHENTFLLHQKKQCLITNNGIGQLKIGMRYAQIKKAYPKAVIEEVMGAENTTMFVIHLHKPKNDDTFFLAAVFDDFQDGKKDPQYEPKISMLMTRSPDCKTAVGIRPGDKLTTAVKRYHGLKYIYDSGSEGRNYAFFKKAPAHLGFQVSQGAAISPDEKTRRSMHYQKDTRIREISVTANK